MHRFKELVEQEVLSVSTVVSPNDVMWNSTYDAKHYFHIGQDAIRNIRIAMLRAEKEDLKSILDLPCGHGRELRTFKAAFPSARITACDIDQDGVDFCAQAFGATPVYSKAQPEQIQIEGSFDLIWCGSLLTHLNSDRWLGFLKLFESLLVPGGIVVLTTHGRFVAERLRSSDQNYGLTQNAIRDLLQDYDRDGFGYKDYLTGREYGISVALPSWVCAQLENLTSLQLLNLTEKGWDRHQDVVACVRVQD